MNNTPNYPESRLREAESLLAVPIDELYVQIGLDSKQRGIGGGKRRYEVVLQRCRGAICADERVRFLCTSRNADKVTHLVCAVADTVIHTMGIPIPAMTVAAIAVNSGIDLLCAEQWRK